MLYQIYKVLIFSMRSPIFKGGGIMRRIISRILICCLIMSTFCSSMIWADIPTAEYVGVGGRTSTHITHATPSDAEDSGDSGSDAEEDSKASSSDAELVQIATLSNALPSPVSAVQFELKKRETGSDFNQMPDGYTVGDIPRPGEDYSAEDSYIRSYDRISYELNLKVEKNAEAEEENYNNIIVHITVKVPGACDTVTGLQKVGVGDVYRSSSYDAETGELEAVYEFRTNTASELIGVTLPIDIGGAKQGEIFAPEFTCEVVAVGNVAYKDQNSLHIAGEDVIVSAAPNLGVRVGFSVTEGIKLKDVYPEARSEEEWTELGVAVMMIPHEGRSDIKGVEIPQGKIRVDFSSELLKELQSGGAQTDLYQPETPRIRVLDYGYNLSGFWGQSSVKPFKDSQQQGIAPESDGAGNPVSSNAILPGSKYPNTVTASAKRRYVQNSGVLTAGPSVDKDGKINKDDLEIDANTGDAGDGSFYITFSDYEIGNTFPVAHMTASDTHVAYKDYEKIFAVGSLVLLIPLDKLEENYKIIGKVKAETITVFDDTGQVSHTFDLSKQKDETHITAMRTVVIYPKGTIAAYSAFQYERNKNISSDKHDFRSVGDGSINRGSEVSVRSVSTLKVGTRAEGGTDLIQKWNPHDLKLLLNKDKSDFIFNARQIRSTLNQTEEPQYIFYGILKADSDGNNASLYEPQALNTYRRQDYTWYETPAQVIEENAANEKKISAIMTMHFKPILSPGTIQSMDPRFQVIKQLDEDNSKNATSVLTFAVAYYTQRDEGAWTDLENLNGERLPEFTYGQSGIIEQPISAAVSSSEPYFPTEYSEYGSMVKTHVPSRRFGDTVYVLPYKAGITASILDENSVGGEKTNYFTGDTVHWELTPTLIHHRVDEDISDGDDVVVEITIKVQLPDGFIYDPASSMFVDANGVRIDVFSDAEGNVISPVAAQSGNVLSWTMKVKVGEQIPFIRYDTVISQGLIFDGLSTKAKNSVIIEAEGEFSQEYQRRDEDELEISRVMQVGMEKSVSTPLIEVDAPIRYYLDTIIGTSYSQSNVALLDILPYQGDGRNTEFTGTYKISNFSSYRKDKSPLEPEVYYTTSQNVRGLTNAGEVDLNGTDIRWEKYSADSTVTGVTAIYVVYTETLSQEDGRCTTAFDMTPIGSRGETSLLTTAPLP